MIDIQQITPLSTVATYLESSIGYISKNKMYDQEPEEDIKDEKYIRCVTITCTTSIDEGVIKKNIPVTKIFSAVRANPEWAIESVYIELRRLIKQYDDAKSHEILTAVFTDTDIVTREVYVDGYPYYFAYGLFGVIYIPGLETIGSQKMKVDARTGEEL